MRNQPLQSVIATQSASRGRERNHGRMRLLFVVMLIPFATIASRVWYLQAVAAGRFVVQWDNTTTVIEQISARDGRILTADGLELAYDRTRFDVAMHYRWLEDPVDPQWLRDQARSRLTPGDRRNPQKIEQAEAEVLQTREQFWTAFNREVGASIAESLAARARIQSRIERMAESVKRRRKEKQDTDVTEEAESEEDELSPWSRGWSSLVKELTTPPHREKQDPIILKEELDYHIVASDVPFAVAAAIQSAPATFPSQAVTIRTSTQRVYPSGELASHVVGVRRSSGSVDSHRRTSTGGVEQAYDAVLRGKPGVQRVVYNRRREILRKEIVQEPVDGRDVTLTFDAILQGSAEQILDAALAKTSETDSPPESDEATASDAPPQGGTLVAIDVATGDILAAAAAPRFDLSLFSNFDQERWNVAMEDPRHPFFPRVTALSAPPGSVYKVLTAVAALESSAIDGTTPLHCRGYLDRPDQLRCMIFRQHGASHGDVTLADALCQSCNVYFFEAARRMGPEPLRLWSERFGFGAPTGVDIPGEVAGRLPTATARNVQGKKTPGSTLQFAIGQSTLEVSPLQVARMMAAIANGGRLTKPRFVQPEAMQSAPQEAGVILAGYADDVSSPQIAELSPRTLAIIREGLRMVVDDPRGTGKSARVQGVTLAGKTGTAETGGGQPDHAWFAGYVPADRPRIAFVVMLEHAGSGGRAAGPIVKQFVEALVATGRIRADDSFKTEAATASR